MLLLAFKAEGQGLRVAFQRTDNQRGNGDLEPQHEELDVANNPSERGS